MQPYASDALEDAMRLAQTKALNSYTFSDCLNYLNYAWMDIYQQIVQQDEGYYSKTQLLTKRLTTMPPFVKNSIRVYAAREPVGFNRDIFRESGYNDLQSWNTYHISGFDLYCPQAEHTKVWVNYIPMQPQIFFTMNNRDPKLYEEYERVESDDYNLYMLERPTDPDEDDDPLVHGPYWLRYKNRLPLVGTVDDYDLDITHIIARDATEINTATPPDPPVYEWCSEWKVVYLSCDFPYIFVTYQHKHTHEYLSGFFRDITKTVEFTEYNPFAYTGRNSNVEYVEAHWNDKTGMGVVINDYNDLYPKEVVVVDEDTQEETTETIMVPHIKELGWTPDSMLVYPAPEVYRLLVARLADKFSALNESNVMGVSKELVEAQYAFVNFIAKDKSAWKRIDNVNGPNLSDIL
jgi:hypothetical protein